MLMEILGTYNEYECIVPPIEAQIQYSQPHFQACLSSIFYHIKLISPTEMVTNHHRAGTSLTQRFSRFQGTQECCFRAAHASIHDAIYSVLSQRGIINLKKGISLCKTCIN